LLAGIFVKGRCPTDAFIFQSAENAFKYTPAEVCDPFYGQTAAFVLVSVKDTGMGLLQNICRSFSSVFGDPTELGLDG